MTTQVNRGGRAGVPGRLQDGCGWAAGMKERRCGGVGGWVAPLGGATGSEWWARALRTTKGACRQFEQKRVLWVPRTGGCLCANGQRHARHRRKRAARRAWEGWTVARTAASHRRASWSRWPRGSCWWCMALLGPDAVRDAHMHGWSYKVVSAVSWPPCASACAAGRGWSAAPRGGQRRAVLP